MSCTDTSDHACTCAQSCGCHQGGFARLRFFFGQRLAAVDLSDEQGYLVGKHRLHQQRLHGVGVVCGLTAERVRWPQNAPPDAPSTVLRVAAGFAIDACGRDLLVDGDQCIDVAAWFARNAATIGWTDAGTQPVVVAIRYRECPSDPAPAPRDPCGCTGDGCEYGRIREGFELALMTPEQAAERCVPADFAFCAACPEQEWLALAQVPVVLALVDTRLTVTDLGTPDNAIPLRRTLLATGQLQERLLPILAADDALAASPRWGEPTASGTEAAATIALPVTLLEEAGVPVPLEDATIPASLLTVAWLDTGAWKTATPGGVGVDAATGTVSFTGLALTIGTTYRLTLDAPAATPPVDGQLRAILPLRLIRTRTLVDAGGGAIAFA